MAQPLIPAATCLGDHLNPAVEVAKLSALFRLSEVLLWYTPVWKKPGSQTVASSGDIAEMNS